MIKKILSVISFLVIFTAASHAESLYVIDTPSTDMLDYGSYGLNFRLFTGGGILTRLDFGVFRIVNLGCAWELSNVVGSQNIYVSPPKIHFKIRPFEGGINLPAFVMGYDGQGYGYDRESQEFVQREKGVFMAIGRETLIPGLKMTLGGNMSDFKTNVVNGFVSAVFNMEDKFLLLCEYDNIHNIRDNRLNAGFRFFINQDLSVDMAGRDIGAAGREAERIIKINYTGKF